MNIGGIGQRRPAALSLLSSERPRNVGWGQAAGLLFGDWGTSRLYVLGLAFFFAGRMSFYLICMMSLLILAVGWAYSQICRIYPDGGGVYTAAKHQSRALAVIGALLLFADYVVTASLSVLDAFHYFGLKDSAHLFAMNSPGLWAILAILLIGAFNFMGPKHTGTFAMLTAVGMILITLMITCAALPFVDWRHITQHIGSIHWKALNPIQGVKAALPANMWTQFVSIVLALSGVEAIANLTGVMRRPVSKTSRKAIWVVALEVAIFNVLLALCMVAVFNNPAPGQEEHRDDMLAFLSGHYMHQLGAWLAHFGGVFGHMDAWLGHFGEWSVRIIGGLLLMSAGNTAITDMISVQYLMARDGELPQVLQGLNRFGVPWVPAIIASAVPALVVFISPDVEQLSHLYAIGVVGAVAINVSLCAFHPRLHRLKRKLPMILLGLILMSIWVTLAYEKRQALEFVLVVMICGLTARFVTKWWARRKGVKTSLLRQAIMEQLTPDVLSRPKMLLGTYGSDALARPAMEEAKREGCTLVVCFIRQVNLSYKWEAEQRLSIDTDPVATRTFARFLELGHEMGVGLMPSYDTGPDAAELMAENAAIYGCQKVLIGTSRHGMLHRLIKGTFQRRLESMLPPEIPVEVITAGEEPKEPEMAKAH